MKIHQFVYTKVAPDASPHGKSGFHMLFYPTDFLTKKTLLELESHVHYPGPDLFARKRTYFFKKIEDVNYLVVIFLTPLPEMKDEFGRTGVFIAQGFLVPPGLWRQRPRFTEIAALLEPHLFADNLAALNAEQTDPDTGNLPPAEIAPSGLPEPESGLRELDKSEKQVFNALYSLLTRKGEDVRLVVKGSPDEADELLGQCAARLPEELREQVGWDGGFDGGKLFFYPLRVAAYSKQAPTTGAPLHYSVSGAAFQGHERLSIYASADAFYERWVGKAPPEHLKWRESVYRLSQYLERSAAELPELPPDEALAVFAEANEDKVATAFRALLSEQPVIGKGWVVALYEQLGADRQMMLILDNFQLARLAEALEEIILDQRIAPENVSEPIPAKVAQSGGQMIQALSLLWTRDAIPLKTLQQFGAQDQLRLFRYLSETEFAESDWLYERLLHAPDAFYALLEDERFQILAQTWLADQVPDPWRPARDLAAQSILAERMIGDFAVSKVDWKLALERWLEKNEWTNKNIRRIHKAGRKAGEIGPEYPLLRQLARPASPAPNDLGADMRRMLIRAQIEILGLTPRQLKTLGWNKEDVKAALKTAKSSLFYMLKSILR